MIRIGILSNPQSHRNKAGLAGIRELAHRNPGVAHREVLGPVEIAAALGDFARGGVGLVVLNGGDGTVQAALTTLFTESPFERPPLLAVLRGGMTNMIALDVGLGGRREAALKRLFERAAANRLDDAAVTRALIRLEPEPGAKPQIGMFFGTAGICRLIRATRSNLEARGIEATAAAGGMLAGVIASHLLGRHGEGGLLSGDRIGIRFDEAAHTDEQDWMLALVTTLDRLMLRIRPFWGLEPGALRFAGIQYPPHRLLRGLTAILRGRGGRLGPDYVSRNSDSISLSMRCAYTLDGEMFDPVPGLPVVLSAGGTARFIRF